MGYSTYPPTASGVIKSIQRGTASVAGTVTITSVDMTKSTVTSFSNGSSGVVALSGNANLTLGAMGAGAVNYGWGNGGSTSISSTASGGTNTLVAASSGAYLSSSTEITVDGPCIWQVLEYN